MSMEEKVKEISRLMDLRNSEDPFKKEGTIKVLVAVPSGGQIDVLAYDNHKDFFIELGHIQQNSNFQFFSATTGRMLVTFARDTLAEEALRGGMDWILFFDDDQILPKKMFLGLARHMDKADIIVPLVFQRVHPYRPVLYKITYEEKDGKVSGKSDHILDYPVNDVFEVGASGCGVMLIRTEVLKKMEKPWFFSNRALGEDIYFCIRAKDLGFKILADTRVKVGHLGIPPCITELDFLKNNKEYLEGRRKEEIEKIKSNSEPILTAGIQ